jgi:beta-N-acetylhexosaminidase
MQVVATEDEEMGYRLGVICGREGRTVGCNWTFSSVIDIDSNFQNPIIDRSFLQGSPL